MADREDEDNPGEKGRHCGVPPVGMALGDGVVVRMRLEDQESVKRWRCPACGHAPG